VNRNVTVPVGGLATTTSMSSLLPLRGHYSSGALPGLSVQRSVLKKVFFSWKFRLHVSVGNWGAWLCEFGVSTMRRAGWVAEMGRCLAGCAHPLEKSATIFRNARIYCFHPC
jgi:hypothetical protein